MNTILIGLGVVVVLTIIGLVSVVIYGVYKGRGWNR